MALLSNELHYSRVSQTRLNQLRKDVETLLLKTLEKGDITEDEWKFLSNTNPKTPAFYGLPKVHKSLENPPLRPIVASIDSLLEPLSQYADRFLKPLVEQQKSYIRDTADMIAKVEGMHFDESSELMVTLDVESLYTNIPQNDTIKAVESLLEGTNVVGGNKEFIVKCVAMVLLNNIFLFKKDLYIQKKGTSMGATCAPSLACIYVSLFENKHIYNEVSPYYENIRNWARFIDDIFFIWQGTTESLLEFLSWLNLGDPNLKFTAAYSSSNVNFLDICIKSQEKHLKVELYKKESDRNTILHYNSYHLKSQKDSIPFGEFLRLRRNCTDLEDFYRHAQEMKTKFRERGYPKKLIEHSLKRARFYDRDCLLSKKEKKKTQDKIVMVSQYSAIANQVKNIINRNWKIVNNGPDITTLERPLYAYRKNKNLRSTLVHTYREDQVENQTTLSGTKAVGNHKCGNCCICDLCMVTKKVEHNGVSHEITTLNNCRTKNVIYMILCPCDQAYIGETGREMRLRVGEHKSAIKNSKENAPLVNHWIEQGHSEKDLRWVILERIKEQTRQGNSTIRRKQQEQWYMVKFNTIRRGLNSREEWEALI
ncbi:uncharacterized protein LOC144797794 [Lissotriton helveticus]